MNDEKQFKESIEKRFKGRKVPELVKSWLKRKYNINLDEKEENREK